MYADGDDLVLVASDRVSIYDVVLPTAIPDKGAVLTQLSLWWFDRLGDLVPNHVISGDDVPPEFAGRAMRCRRLDMLPVECVARGYLTGGGLKDYEKTGAVSGVTLPPGLVDGAQLPEPIFTPSTKAPLGRARRGHDLRGGRGPGGGADRRPAAGPDAGGLRARCRDGGGERDPRRRHQAGVRPRPGDGGDRAGRRGADAGLVPVLACATAGRPAARSPRSTSSSCATGRRRSTGTAPHRARRSLRRSSRPPAPATSRRTSASQPAAGPDSPTRRRGCTVHPISSNCDATFTRPVGLQGGFGCVAASIATIG